ncbi:unnamed protein product [Lactuca virosa]|uniref:Uncharacterized protein n=1 Tax=Lactuca virosa TaxID=75947 RepID=A0AAU9NRP1_9ASTR|nr:unnamed protein product [Lactuca virosa]
MLEELKNGLKGLHPSPQSPHLLSSNTTITEHHLTYLFKPSSLKKPTITAPYTTCHHLITTIVTQLHHHITPKLPEGVEDISTDFVRLVEGGNLRKKTKTTSSPSEGEKNTFYSFVITIV